MIRHSFHGETFTQRIGVQKTNLHYTYLHWRHNRSSSKFLFREYKVELDQKVYRPIGPTMLVEWTDA